jgi:RNA polymerase sigma factor (sigma-70 family)
MNVITEQHIGKFKWLARKLSGPHFLPNWIYEELVSVGLETLTIMAPRFDPEHTPDLDGFLMKRVKWAMLDLIRQQYWSSKEKKPKCEFCSLHERDGATMPQQHRGVNRMMLNRAIAKLPSRERTILVMYYWEGRSQLEISKIMGMSEGRVSQLKTQALLTLRTQFGRA